MKIITVKGSWLDACGRGNKDRDFQILRTEIKGGWTFHTIATPWGEWQVLAEWRCIGGPREIDHGQDMTRSQPIVPVEISWEDVERDFPGAMSLE